MSPPPRKRGRPITTGEFVGLAAAKRELAEAHERDLEVQAEQEMWEEERSRREERSLFLRDLIAREGLDRLDPADPKVEAARRRYLVREVEDAVKTVSSVARASKNLKGTAVKALNMAAKAISEASDELGSLQATDEVRRLERDKLAQQIVIDQLRKELVEARAWRPGVGGSGEGVAILPPPSLVHPTTGRSTPVPNTGDASSKVFALEEPLAARAAKAAAAAARKTRRRDPFDPAGFPPLPSMRDHTLMDTGEKERSGVISPLPPAAASGLSLEARLEENNASVIRQMGDILAARFAALEARLLPETSLRPPLGKRPPGEPSRSRGADSRPVPSAVPSTTVDDAGDWRWEMPREQRRKGRARRGWSKTLPDEAPPPSVRKAPAAGPFNQGAAGKGKGKAPLAPKKGDRVRVPPQPQQAGKTGRQPMPKEVAASYARMAAKQRPPGGPTAARSSGRTGGPGPSGPSGPRVRPGPTPPTTSGGAKRRAPRRAAAVTITLLPQTGEEKRTLAEALTHATQAINLGDLEIESLRPKRAATGGLILEVPGEDSAARADSLAVCLEAALRDYPVRIGRPVRRTDIRLTGLDDAATPTIVAGAVAAAGGCREADVRVGALTRSSRGLLAATANCPERAAYKVASPGKLRVGWVTARVTQLTPRPLQCHRCMAFGHVRVACKATEDRSGLCYRCGEEGHLAAACTAPARCILCRGAGRQADHRMGGPSCGAVKGPKKPAPAARTPSKGTVKAPAKAAPRGASKKQEPKGVPKVPQVGKGGNKAPPQANKVAASSSKPAPKKGQDKRKKSAGKKGGKDPGSQAPGSLPAQTEGESTPLLALLPPSPKEGEVEEKTTPPPPPS